MRSRQAINDDFENADDDEDSENSEEDSDFDSDTGEMDVDDHGDWLDLSEFGKMPEKPPTSMAFPACSGEAQPSPQQRHGPRQHSGGRRGVCQGEDLQCVGDEEPKQED